VTYRSPTVRSLALLTWCGAATSLLACTWDPPARTDTTSGPGAGFGGRTAGTGAGGTGVSVTNPPTNTGDRCIFSDPDSIDCGGKLYSGQGITPDIYVVFDVSGSMATKDDGTTERIDQVRGALLTFLNDPASAGIGVGIGYFGTQPLSCACTSCNPADYSTPAIPIAPLPGQLSALTTSLNAAAPTGETPTGAALRGSCGIAVAYKQAHPGHDVVLLLVTDGEPQAPLTSRNGGCNPTLADATAAASTCLQGAVTIRTYVLGVGPSLQNLNQIAAAGGTTQAYLAANAGGTEILAQLNQIRKDAAIPCTLQIPQPSGSTPINLHTVNVVSADASCKTTTIGNVADASSCNATLGGWYYEPPTQPTKIKLCDTSCTQVQAPGTDLHVTVGCATTIIP
jgi:von Willebrand factor type A domain